jgi:hypothetical protein
VFPYHLSYQDQDHQNHIRPKHRVAALYLLTYLAAAAGGLLWYTYSSVSKLKPFSSGYRQESQSYGAYRPRPAAQLLSVHPG